MKKTAIAIVLFAGLASTASAAIATFSISEQINANTVTVTVSVDVAGLGDGAIAGYGLDFAITGGNDLVVDNSLSVATHLPPLTTGTLPGSVSGDMLSRVIGGQVANIFNANPSVDPSAQLDLFTVTFDLFNGANGDITIELSEAGNGGFLVYADVNGSANSPADTIFTPYTFSVVPAPGAIGLMAVVGAAAPRRRRNG